VLSVSQPALVATSILDAVEATLPQVPAAS
jgi:hypothetical protein